MRRRAWLLGCALLLVAGCEGTIATPPSQVSADAGAAVDAVVPGVDGLLPSPPTPGEPGTPGDGQGIEVDLAEPSGNDRDAGAPEAPPPPPTEPGPDGGEPEEPSCLPAREPCQADEACCEGLSCGTTTLGQVCCGGEGAPCATANGEDCCGALLCTGGRCTAPGAGGTLLRAPIATDHLSAMYVSAYFDHGGRDWNCGTNRYGGHQGNDIACKNGLGCIDQGRDVVAAAAGEVIAKQDGAFDRCTSAACSPPNGNFVRLRHADGSTSWYLHMKQFSITVNVGDTVACGQKLGQVASSGQSTGAHLHFHYNRSQAGAPADPFGGACSQPESRWVAQQGHNPGGTSAGPEQLPAPVCQ